MIVTSAVGMFAVFFAYLTRFPPNKNGLKFSFSLIFLYLALRYMFGNDYSAYLDIFEEINKYSHFKFHEIEEDKEIGWVLLCRLFKPFGFFVMIAFLAAFNCVVYYNFIRKYVPAELYWFAVFIYVFNPAFMLTQLTAMRQNVAICVFIFSLDYIFSRNAFLYCLCIGFATFFHSSAIILFPIYFIGVFNGKIRWYSGIVVVSIFISFFYWFDEIGELIVNAGVLFPKYLKVYGDFEPATLSSGLGLVYSCTLALFIIYFERFQDRSTALVFKISIISFFFIPLSMILFFIGRMELYFVVGLIVVIPLILNSIKNQIVKFIFTIGISFMVLFSYFQHFNSEVYKKGFEKYRTIFSSSRIH